MKLTISRPINTNDIIPLLKQFGHKLVARRECDQIDFDLYFDCTECYNSIIMYWRGMNNDEVEYRIHHIKPKSFWLRDNDPEIYCEKYRLLI